MLSRRIVFPTLSFATAVFVAATALPSLAANSQFSSINDGRVHGFNGCLTQEASGMRYFDLTNAKSDNGVSLSTVRLTGSLYGIQPKDSLNRGAHVNGIYLGRSANDPGNGHIAVEDVQIVGGQCS
jgi:hypothetical protein